MEKEFVCIACPVGCRLKVWPEGEEIKVTGNTCPRGVQYGIQEYADPQRTVTTTVWVKGGAHPLCPVKTAKPVPKAKVDQVLAAARALRVTAPVRIGDTLLAGVAGTGADLVATRDVAAR